jgi:hypothetical protein
MTALSGLVGFCMLVIRLAMPPSLYPLGSGQIRSVLEKRMPRYGLVFFLCFFALPFLM